jgi:hypothetical protein
MGEDIIPPALWRAENPIRLAVVVVRCGGDGGGYIMSSIRGTIQDGQVVLSKPADLPNGTRVTVEPMAIAESDELPDDDDASPEAIARRLALIDRIQPFLSPEDEVEWKKALAEQKAFQLATWDDYCKKLESLFDDVKPTAVIDSAGGTRDDGREQ